MVTFQLFYSMSCKASPDITGGVAQTSLNLSRNMIMISNVMGMNPLTSFHVSCQIFAKSFLMLNASKQYVNCENCDITIAMSLLVLTLCFDGIFYPSALAGGIVKP